MDRGRYVKKCLVHIFDVAAEYYRILLKNTCVYTHHTLLRKTTVIAV